MRLRRGEVGFIVLSLPDYFKTSEVDIEMPRHAWPVRKPWQKKGSAFRKIEVRESKNKT